MLFKDIREQTVVHAVVIGYYWKFYVNSVELAFLDHVVVCSLLKVVSATFLLVCLKQEDLSN